MRPSRRHYTALGASHSLRMHSGLDDRAHFDREHLQVVNSTLAARIKELEAGQERMAAVVAIAQEVVAQRTSSARLGRVCAASRDVTLARHALLGLVDAGGTATLELFSSGFEAAASADLTSPPIHGSPLERVVGQRHSVRLVLSASEAAPFNPRSGRSVTTSVLAVPLATSAR